MKLFCCFFGILLVGATQVGAITGIEIGVKGGIVSNYDQPGLSLSTYDINRLNMLGGQIYISTLPLVDVILAADYSWRKETYSIAGMGFEFKMRDLSATASAVYPFKLSFATIYGGGGIGTHSLSYEYLRPLSLSLADNDITIPETSSYFGYHGLIGAKMKIPVLPVGFFVEGRMTRVNSPGEDTDFNTWAGGIFLALP